MNRIFQINNGSYYFVLCVICLLFTFLTKHFLLTDQLYYTTFEEQYTTEQIQIIVKNLNTSWQNIIGYLLIPIIIIIRILYSSFCLFVGNLVQEYHWTFKSLFNISLKADAVFCLNSIFNFYYYALADDFKTIEDLGINSVSLLKIVGKENIPNWLIFAYNSINIFELLYIVLLILFIRSLFKCSYFKSTAFVVLTYGIGNYLYIFLMTFIYLNYL